MREESTILLVEDDPNDVILIKRAFEKAKIANPITVVRDGEEAIEYLDRCGPDEAKAPIPILILLDLRLPRKSGFEVLEHMRGMENAVCRVPVVVLTSSKHTSDINRAYELGANSYLVKPISFDGLVDMVDTLKLYWLIINQPPEVV